jgi:hypothetical protein
VDGKEDESTNKEKKNRDQQRSRDRIRQHTGTCETRVGGVVYHSTIPMPGASNLNSSIPSGFVVLNGVNDEQYLVPTFMASATEQAIEAERHKRQLEVDNAEKGVSLPSHLYCL